MKITFDNWNQNQNVEKSTISQGTFSHYREIRNGAYSLDISGTVMDNNAYADHGRSAKEVMQEFGAELDNLAVKRDQMTVMSNIMSTEDFNKMMEDGFDLPNWIRSRWLRLWITSRPRWRSPEKW